MACQYATRPNFEYMVQLPVHVDYVKVKPPQQFAHPSMVKLRTKGPVRTIAYMIVKKDDKIGDYKAVLESNPDSPVIRWLKSDAAQGRWTYKFFLNRILMSFEDKDTAFAFKMRWL
jgi:hypothetical protein